MHSPSCHSLAPLMIVTFFLFFALPRLFVVSQSLTRRRREQVRVCPHATKYLASVRNVWLHFGRASPWAEREGKSPPPTRDSYVMYFLAHYKVWV